MGGTNRGKGSRITNGKRLRDSSGRYVAREKPENNAEGGPGPKERPLRPGQCAGHLRQELAGSFRAIVRGFVKQAESGSVQHLKLTTEILRQPATVRKRKGSAQLLLEDLERMGREKAPEAEGEDGWRE